MEDEKFLAVDMSEGCREGFLEINKKQIT